MNLTTTGAKRESAEAIRASLPQLRRHHLPQPPYAYLSARDLRRMVAAMVD